ncbi:hypothetical protein UPYG_G00115640 [Umbra pygmaea]|uniref:Fibronectin type-III domain-containing protein n=1 Tax=Umbra pygmaea TaxID=75934 RepID=A0ABD0XP13_UMBPY
MSRDLFECLYWGEGNMSMFGRWFILLISLQGYKAPFTPNVSCLIVNLDFVNCSWTEQGIPEKNSTFFHNRFNTQSEHMEECSTYLYEKGCTVGCRLPFKHSDRFTTLRTKLVHQNQSYMQNHNLKNMVQLYPPANLSVEISTNRTLNLYWNNSKNSICTESEVNYRINNNEWKSFTPRREQNFSLHFPSKSSRYEFQVRARLKSLCGESKLWSDWSQIAVWDSMKESNNAGISGDTNILWKLLLSIVGTTIFLMLACMLVYWKRERLRLILVPIVPNPGKNLKDFLDSDNEEARLHISKDVCFQPNFNERACPVREYIQVPQTGSISDSESNRSMPIDQSDCLLFIQRCPPVT